MACGFDPGSVPEFLLSGRSADNKVKGSPG
jgi:hypothetical protein